MAKANDFGIGEGELIVLGLVAIGAWIFTRGGLSNAAIAAGEAAVGAISDAATGAVAGTASGIGKVVGLPGVTQTTDDPYIARWIIDQPNGGNFEASKWASSSAFLNALTIPEGQGSPPPAGSPLWRFGDTIDFGTGDGWN